MRYNDKGSKVRELQQSLQKAGYELPTYGADGHLGDETWEALKDFALDHGFVWNPEISDGVVNAMVSQMGENEIQADDLLRVPSYDLREEAVPFAVHRKFKMRANKVVRRAPSAIDGITIHQTAVQFGVNDRQIEAAQGDERLALARRVKKVAAHVVTFDGFYTKNYPLDFYIYHAGLLNRKTLGIEVDGLYPGLLDDPDTNAREDLESLWKGSPTPFTEGRLKAARAGVRFLVEEGRKLGMPIKYIYAHRQSSSTRRSDPGEEIWRKVVLEYAVPVLGLETRPDFTIGTGRPIPDEWSPDGKGPY